MISLFSERWRLALVLIIIVITSYWVLKELTGGGLMKVAEPADQPDYYMENFTTLTMGQDGRPRNRLNAAYMVPSPNNDTTELHEPELALFRLAQAPIMIRADKAWVTLNNDVILLKDNVYLYQNDAFGEPEREVIAEDARILLDQDYIETDKSATLINKRTVINAIGMRAYLKEKRMQFLSNVRTTIEPKKTL